MKQPVTLQQRNSPWFGRYFKANMLYIAKENGFLLFACIFFFMINIGTKAYTKLCKLLIWKLQNFQPISDTPRLHQPISSLTPIFILVLSQASIRKGKIIKKNTSWLTRAKCDQTWVNEAYVVQWPKWNFADNIFHMMHEPRFIVNQNILGLSSYLSWIKRK